MLRLFVLASAFLACGAVAAPASALIESGAYIVTFDDPPLAAFRGFEGDADVQRAQLKATSPAVTGEDRLDVRSPAAKTYRAWLAERRDERLGAASARLGRLLEPAMTFDVVNNAVLLVLTADEARQLAQLPGVTTIEPDGTRQLHTDAGPQWIRAGDVWAGTGGVATRGAGVVVGIVDSGINRTHPSFAGVGPIDGHQHVNPRGVFYGQCVGNPALCTSKLIGIHDFTLCTGVHSSTSCDDREPNDGLDPDGHGSHVASTAVGNRLNASISVATGAVTRSLSGVAPHASLIAYKACEEEEDCRLSWLLAALNQAVADRVDVINYSIGSSPIDPWGAIDATAMLNAREAGVVVVVSAGNSGPRAGTVGTPANAPWVISAANSTHDRAIVNRLVDLTGGASAPPEGGVLLGVGSTAGYGPAAILVPLDFPGCSIGSDIDSPPSGASSPWVGQVFSGQIVVCERGVQARVAKSNNVRLAGGGGMVLTNTATEGESVVSDPHSIPGTHMGFMAGTQLRQWLASGSGHRGRIEGAQVRSEPQVADILASSSSRGPSTVPGILKPSVAAPGSSVLAAAGTGNGFAFLTGTSMSAPHVTGSVALLRAVRPNWTVSDVESALSTSARPVIRSSDGSRVASAFEQGAGRVDVPNALRAGLGFPVTPQAFRDARPLLGGQPKTLNQAALVDPNCMVRCSFVRQVRDLVGQGRWRVDVELPEGARAIVSPAEFDLASAATQSLQIELILDGPQLAGQWVTGGLVLRRVSGPPAADSRITVNVFSSPGALPLKTSLLAGSDRSMSDITLGGLIALPDLTVVSTDLVAPAVRTETVPQDLTGTAVYDSFGTANGNFFSLVSVPPASTPSGFRLVAEARSSTAFDVDLFVGVDVNGNGQPDQSEEVCRSTTSGATEACRVEIAAASAAQTYWVLAQNFRSGQTGSDALRLATALVELKPGDRSELVVTGPATVPAGANLPLRVVIDAPSSASSSTLIGYVGLSAVADAPRPFGWMQIEVERSNAPPAARALVPGRTQSLRLDAGVAADRWFVDVPANATTLTIRSSGAGEIDLFAAHVAAPATPVIASAPPRAQAAVSATGPGAAHTLTVSGPTLQPGRWYVTPVNAGDAPANFALSVELSYASNRAEPRFGAYFDSARAGSGLFLFPVGDSWGMAWYTYLEDGTPTWYLGVAGRPGAQQGQWQVDLLRYRWNGSAAIGTRVGEALLSINQELSFGFSFSLDSGSGSQTMSWIGDARCPSVAGSPLDVTGLWFSPERPGFGYSVIASPDFESVGAYFYDSRGVARWSLGTATPFGAGVLDLDWRNGSCPLCSFSASALLPALGSLTRSYQSATGGQFGVGFELPPPLDGSWLVDLPAVRLSDAIGCP